MKVLRCLLLLLIVFVTGTVAHADPTPSEKAVRAVLDAQVVAWNKGDLDGFMIGYWKSPDLTFISGSDLTRGWQPTLERYQKKYQGEGKEMGKLAFSELEVVPLGEDAMLVRGRYELKRSKDMPSGRFTLLFRRFPEGWRIVHDHTSN
jgi:ketosteroid isomerase-like protein